MLKNNSLIILVFCVFASFSAAHADGSNTLGPTPLEKATGEELSIAVGHYAKARSLLLAAIQEFDSGYKLADPKVILDVKEWRNGVIDRAQALESLLDPQPRVSRKGMKYRADRRLLNEANR